MRKLNEFFGFQALSTMPQNVDVTVKDIENLKKTKWNKISMLDPDATDIGNAYVFDMNFDFKKELNHILPGVVFKIEQDKRTELNQPHIQVHKDLQGLGIAYNLYRSTLEEFGHVVSKQSKRLSNKEISKLYKKLAKDSKIDYFEQNGNMLLLHKGNTKYKETLDMFHYVS